ncbi:MAG: inner membrane protein YhjD [Mycobacterium sp.]|nr:inner membrane protein YhjD [Mycobacterium sp.]
MGSVGAVGDRVARLRARFRWLDHVVRAQQRYDTAKGDFCAAAVTYFTIFAMFPLLMVGFAVVGFMLASRPALLAEIDSRVKSAVTGEFANQVLSLMNAAIESRTSVGLIGLATALWAGLSWMNHLRGALTQMWCPDADVTQGFVSGKISDLAALVSTFVASLLTIGLTALANGALHLGGAVRGASVVMSILVAWLLFTWMIARLPRDAVAMRRAVAAGLLAAVGFELFKQGASIYLRLVMHGPAGTTFGPVFGLMVFAYFTARLVLFATAWAATSATATGPEPAD